MTARTRHTGADQFVPDSRKLSALRAAARDCRGCDLYERATQTVFGSGARRARLFVVGEQPGDVEDTQGRPFVGPAGRVLDRALRDAGLDDIPRFSTNAVKHFGWRPAERGKRRIHEKPSAAQSSACRPWLAAELAAVRPEVVVALGATAAGSLFGSGFRLTPNRGISLDWPPPKGDFVSDTTDVDSAFATVHPSAVLRVPKGDREAAYRDFVRDLAAVADALP